MCEPELRGRGYASALVAKLSQHMLDSGFSFCVLYTDLANPRSNAIYEKIGYTRGGAHIHLSCGRLSRRPKTLGGN
ncbi:MAG: GNAT family N-acetyltransferase [Candidatus Poribacteria bacterium]